MARAPLLGGGQRLLKRAGAGALLIGRQGCASKFLGEILPLTALRVSVVEAAPVVDEELAGLVVGVGPAAGLETATRRGALDGVGHLNQRRGSLFPTGPVPASSEARRPQHPRRA